MPRTGEGSASSHGTCDDNHSHDFGDEPQAKPAPLQLHTVLQGGHAPLSRFVDACRVELHSLQRKELNGRQGVILDAPPPPHERVPVQLDGAVPPIMVKPQNILILPPEASGDDSMAANSSDESSAADSDSSANEDPAEPHGWRRGVARPWDKCLRCGLLGHWARDCTEIVCGNCKQRGHYAADCPKPAPCFRCGQLGHWAKDCPEPPADRRAPPSKTERRWVIFVPPTLKTFRHHCSVCGYTTSVVTKASGGMPRHKCNGEWCIGSGLQPGCSELLDEREDPDVCVPPFHADLDSKLTS